MSVCEELACDVRRVFATQTVLDFGGFSEEISKFCTNIGDVFCNHVKIKCIFFSLTFK